MTFKFRARPFLWFYITSCFLLLSSCYSCEKNGSAALEDLIASDSTVVMPDSIDLPQPIVAADIIIEKDLLYDTYTLEDTYPYQDTARIFQWDKIKEWLAYIENKQQKNASWGILSNYKNFNKEAPLVYTFVRNEYRRVADTLGVERYQSAPLFLPGDTVQPIRYGRDGWLVHVESPDTLDWVQVKGVSFEGSYQVPKRYLIAWGDTVVFNKVVVIDVTNQNITALEKTENVWKVRSMNPSTTGRHKPPYAQNTPVGIFALQQKKTKMFYTHDGSSELAGYAPYANRFTNGAYIHGVPTNDVNAAIIEYSWSLGTVPRSHMCVRVASSHAKFIFDWAKVKESIVIVID